MAIAIIPFSTLSSVNSGFEAVLLLRKTCPGKRLFVLFSGKMKEVELYYVP
jgi:hypothetical protein